MHMLKEKSSIQLFFLGFFFRFTRNNAMMQCAMTIAMTVVRHVSGNCMGSSTPIHVQVNTNACAGQHQQGATIAC